MTIGVMAFAIVVFFIAIGTSSVNLAEEKEQAAAIMLVGALAIFVFLIMMAIFRALGSS